MLQTLKKGVSQTRKSRFNKNSKKNYYIVMGLTIIFLFFFIIFLVLSQHKIKRIVHVTERGNIDYSVCVSENDYYTEKCLDKGMQYIASLIDYIDIKFNYELLADSKVDYDYKYRVESKVNVFAKNDPDNVIYTNTKKLLEEKVEKLNNKFHLSIKENIKLNYDDYNERVRKFKNQYGVSADSNVLIKVYIEPIIKSKELKNEIRKNEVILELSIPLSENQINIKAETKDIYNTNDYKKETMGVLNYIYLIGSIISGITSLTLIGTFIFMLTSVQKNKTPYQKEVEKILREYDYIISESDTIIDPDETEYQYTDMKSFKDLKEMALNTDKQIICSELKELKSPARTWFYIINEQDKRIYRFAVYSKK